MLNSCKFVQIFVAFFPSLKQNFITCRFLKCLHVQIAFFEIHQLWQSGFCRVYCNSCCSCLFESEILKIGQSSHKMNSNNILNFQESTIILSASTKKSGNLLKAPRISIYFVSIKDSYFQGLLSGFITSMEKSMLKESGILPNCCRKSSLNGNKVSELSRRWPKCSLFSLATTPRCREGHHSISWIDPLYPLSSPYNAELDLSKAASSTIFESLVWHNLGLNPGLPDHWQTLYSRKS